MKTGMRLSRRTAGWLVAIFAALVVIHYAYNTSTSGLARTVMGQPAIAVALRGEITELNNHQMTVTLEDPHGDLTELSREITFSDHTKFTAPGHPVAVGQAGLSYLKSGYRVSVSGRGTTDNGIEAQLVEVNFPPLTGTVTHIDRGQLTIKVSGQSAPAQIELTSHTAFFMPDGDIRGLAPGVMVRVFVVPNATANSGLTAVTVMVKSTSTHSA